VSSISSSSTCRIARPAWALSFERCDSFRRGASKWVPPITPGWRPSAGVKVDGRRFLRRASKLTKEDLHP
jgi:hypothetical protein